MRTRLFELPRSTLAAALLALAAGALAGCTASEAPRCTNDRDCGGPDLYCIRGNCIYIPPTPVPGPDLFYDGAVRPQDFSVEPADPNQCPFGTKACGLLPDLHPRCIPNDYCCNNNDCPAVGQTCSADGSCECAVGSKVCLSTCVSKASCCTNDDCASKLCKTDGACAIPSCSDGVQNGNETDVDCGGGFCPRCLASRGCGISLDCRSNACVSMKCGAPGFTSASYGGGNGPVWVVAADLDGDKRADLATANTISNNVSVALARGDGTFNSIGSFSAGVAPVFLAAADLNGDSRVDLVTVNSLGYDVSVLLGRGDGTFAPPVSYPVGASPRWVAIADVSGDGRKDLVVANQISNTVTILVGRGDGRFVDRTDLAVDASPRAVVAGDWNGDGVADLAVAALGKLTVLNNRTAAGVLGFAPPQSTATMITAPATGIVSGDFNEDGKPDLVVGGAALGAQVFLGGGNGAFNLAGATGGGASLTQLLVADIDGDRHLDLATTSGVLLGNGNGSFLNPLPYPGYTGQPSLALAELTTDRKDGKLDVAFPQTGPSTLVTLFGNGDGTVQALSDKLGNKSGSTTDLVVLQPRTVLLADLNGDHRADLLTLAAASKQLWVQLANADGSLQLPSVYGLNDQPTAVAVADLDEDMLPDVIVATLGSPAVLRGSPNGQLLPVVSVMGLPPPIGASNAVAVAAVDLDKDGHVDLVFSDSQGGKLLLGAGNLTFRNNDKPIAIVSAGGARSLQVIDFDGDGWRDLVLANGTAAVIALNKGADGNGVYQGFAAGYAIPGNAKAAGAWATDLDGDGFLDLVVADSAVAQIKVLHNTNPGGGVIAFDPPVSYPVADRPIALAMADVNGDGVLDAVTANNLDRSVSVLLATGKGGFGPPVNYDVGQNPVAIATGDVNGDGKPDFATANQAGSNTMTVLVNTR